MFKMMLSAFALVAFALCASAQRPRACETPEKWEGKVFKVVPNKNVSILGKISYDASNERVRIVDRAAYGPGKRSFSEYIMLFRQIIVSLMDMHAEASKEVIILPFKPIHPGGMRRVYRIVYSAKGKKECFVYEYNKPFRPFAIPRHYNFATEVYIGSSLSGAGVLVNVFYGDQRTRIGRVSYGISVTAEGCVPVRSWLSSRKYGNTQSSFYNIVLGIEDPSRFIPPTDCKCKQGVLESDDVIHDIY